VQKYSIANTLVSKYKKERDEEKRREPTKEEGGGEGDEGGRARNSAMCKLIIL
jgi:hypothetical protein